ncbi:MAG TPA: T9SS type A sorting domain-containing protein [Bacteroidia bacterium]|nr:T9SS type A sorting domain-containing protein [Bacteroidia bacterium]
MAFHTCDQPCNGPLDHVVQMAESDDGTIWTAVPNFPAYSGSVADPVIRGNKLYIYTPGNVRRYDNSSGTWETNPSQVSVVDTNGNPVQFVDPSAFIDSSGNIVLFFLNSTGMTGDPAGCPGNIYPCIKYFNSAVEIPSSDGTQFVMQPGNRFTVTLQNGTASDPDIFFDGTQYIMYISRGQQTEATYASTLHGTYADFNALPSGIIVQQGGIGCGFFDNLSGQYWTYTHTNVSGNTVIRQSVHSGFTSQATNYTTVITAALVGLPSTSTAESPGICENTFLVSVQENAEFGWNFYPNPFINEGFLQLKQPVNEARLEILNRDGKLIRFETVSGSLIAIRRNDLLPGFYYFRIITANNLFCGKFLVL